MAAGVIHMAQTQSDHVTDTALHAQASATTATSSVIFPKYAEKRKIGHL